MFKFFTEKRDVAERHHSMVFVSPSSIPNGIYRGGIGEFIEKESLLGG